ncbi:MULTISPECIES: universal stress protein [Halomonas]|uniref:Universal stress protein YxiE n=2 Tax=Halomonas TaxID=2745 RepID=A0ABQ0U1M7_9GAMM|nr:MULTISPECIES: universal stress protein [Halomonas]PSJ22088.1 universal stress protein [Halomonas sp. ND22Bw]KGE77551.1 universal stress protein [Halomonas salina]MDR5887950.1 universal stress protein [Halomonas salina]RAH38962.1 universal stress protein [Halomonas sp. SL1]WJY08479.1 universal stress protein [Halomonas halophila]
MFHTILVPIDGSEHSRVALCVACKLARQEDGQLILLHIPEALPHEPLLVWGIGAVPMESTLEKRDEVGQALLDHATEEARTLGVEQVKPVLTRGDPSQKILAAAEEHGVDTIVMGSRGLGDLKGLVVGSVSHKVSHGADCRVITVH